MSTYRQNTPEEQALVNLWLSFRDDTFVPTDPHPWVRQLVAFANAVKKLEKTPVSVEE